MHLNVWQQVLTDIASRKPRAIYLDKFFSTYRGDAADVKNFRESLRAAQAPVIAAAALGAAPDKASVALEELFKSWSLAGDAQLPEASISTLIGPHVDIIDAFSGLGHIRVEDSTTAVEPAWRVRQSQRLLPQLSLAGSENVALHRGAIIIDGKEIVLDRHGRIPVNFLERRKIFSGSVSFLNLVTPTVRSSPLGLVEGGLYHASLLNSLTADLSLRPLLQNPWMWFLALLTAAVASALAALLFSQRVSIVLVLVGSLGLIVVGLSSFAWSRLLFDWHILFALFFINGTLSLLVRALCKSH
ncbi:MAG: hypothetical protein FJY29_07045 [Betaproteobacteria bacterium]|nr:hypothetical protein [Betaproteobacteria bacterium]